MTTYSAFVDQPDYVHGSDECTGVLLVNLGTPDAPTPSALRRYLRQFLSDIRVIELPRWQWLPILEGIVLRTRPQRVAKAYAEIWTDDGSPLMAISRRQQAALQGALDERMPGPVHVALGMSYGSPSIPDALAELREAGARRIVLLPLYPQYSTSTTGSVWDATVGELARWRWVPEFRFIQNYADHPGYIGALEQSVREYRERNGSGEMLLFSFHGVPLRYLLNGDPYHCQCHKTARLVAERLGLADGAWKVSFQSRFGSEEWLQPYTDETVQKLARDGIERLDVMCPGFAADCLETIEEIAGENREYFEEAGGKELRYIPALNDREDHILALVDILERHTGGWPETDAEVEAPSRAEREASRERAIFLGAAQ